MLLQQLRKDIAEILDRPQTVCLWFSGGSDSRLLLEVMLETKKPFGILLFQDGWTAAQRKQTDAVIRHHNLQAFSYPALQHLLVAEDGNVSLASGYAIDSQGNTATLMRDLVEGSERCAVDITLPKPILNVAPAEFDIHIQGLRSDDRHWAFGDDLLANGPEWQAGDKTFIAPLWTWGKDVVRATLLEEFGVTVEGEEDTGDIKSCSACLTHTKAFCPKIGKEIKGAVWNSAANLALIRGNHAQV